MKPRDFDMPDADVAWCPGCGNLAILRSLKTALAELEILPQDLVFVSGIGQAGKLPHYIRKCIQWPAWKVFISSNRYKSS